MWDSPAGLPARIFIMNSGSITIRFDRWHLFRLRPPLPESSQLKLFRERTREWGTPLTLLRDASASRKINIPGRPKTGRHRCRPFWLVLAIRQRS